MEKSIDKLKAAIGAGGLQKASHFGVSISCPFAGPPLGDNTFVYVRDVTLPGRNMMTTDIKYGTNLLEKKVNGSAYSPCTITFMCDANMAIYKWFQQWQDRIQDPNSGKISFPDVYEGGVEITAVSHDGGEPHTQKLLKAFPENLGDIQFSHGDTEFATFAVTFAYRHFEVGGNGITIPPAVNQQLQQASNLRIGLNGIGGSFQLGPVRINGNLSSGGFSGNASVGGFSLFA